MRSLLALVLAMTVAVFTGCEYRGDATTAAEEDAAAQEAGLTEGGQLVPDKSAEYEGKWLALGQSGDSSDKQIWEYESGGLLLIDGQPHDYSARWSVFGGEVLKIDGEKCKVYRYGSDTTMQIEYDGVWYYLYGEETDLYKSDLRQGRIESECAELLKRYPDYDGWTENCDCGDIPFLADADYIDESLEQGGFLASTPQELASAVWYINTQETFFPYIVLDCDIDISEYEWAPMGWSGGDSSHSFNGFVSGAGHTIKGLTIDSGDSSVGFIGWETYCAVQDITFDGAAIKGLSNVGVVSGQAIGGSYENITITNSIVDGSMAGAMLGWDANTTKKNCIADVVVNGKPFDFLSYNDKEKSEIVIENPVTITIDEQTHEVTRPEVTGYMNLGWMVFYNGEQVLHRNAEGEYSYTYFLTAPGYYEIYLSAYVQGQYVAISNTVSYTIE